MRCRGLCFLFILGQNVYVNFLRFAENNSAIVVLFQCVRPVERLNCPQPHRTTSGLSTESVVIACSCDSPLWPSPSRPLVHLDHTTDRCRSIMRRAPATLSWSLNLMVFFVCPQLEWIVTPVIGWFGIDGRIVAGPFGSSVGIVTSRDIKLECDNEMESDLPQGRLYVDIDLR